LAATWRKATIVWQAYPDLHGAFVPFRSDPIRPASDAVSVWLRARSRVVTPWPFQADFDDIELRRVRTDVPGS